MPTRLETEALINRKQTLVKKSVPQARFFCFMAQTNDRIR